MNAAKWTREEMAVLADVLLYEEVSDFQKALEDAVAGTGWTTAEFHALCRLVWNGSAWVQ